jgi:hypothetical protein
MWPSGWSRQIASWTYSWPTASQAALLAVLILRGPLLAVYWNLYQICRARFGSAEDRIELSFEVKRLMSNLLPAFAGGILLFLLLSYAFVENFKIVPR